MIQTAESCLEILDDGLTSSDISRAFFITMIASLSMICSSTVAFIMYSNSHLMQHPNKLIFYMCISEAIAANASLLALISTNWIVCYFDLNMLYSWTSIGHSTPESAFKTLQDTNYTIISYFQFLSLSLNFFLCLDLIITLREPFSPHERRMKYYKFSSVIMAALACYMTMEKYAVIRNEYTIVMYKNALSGSIITAYMIFAIFSCAYSYRLTTRPGMSSVIRKDFITRHISYVLVYISNWLPYLGLSLYTVYVCQLMRGDPANISDT
jgi:hypothetical protein